MHFLCWPLTHLYISGVFGFSLLPSIKKCRRWIPSGKTFWIHALIFTYKDIRQTLSLLLDDQVVIMYGITAGCTLIGTTATQAIIFIPKVCITILTYKYIRLSISLLLVDQVVMMYGITTGCRLIETTATRAIAFIPKVCITMFTYKDLRLT